MRFPVTVRHRQSKAKIYAPGKNFAYYRLSYLLGGKRRMQTFSTYTEARTAAERVVREISQGSTAANLSASQAQDALAALSRLATLHQRTGQKFTLLDAVAEFADAISNLQGKSLREAVSGFVETVVPVKRKLLVDAVEAFITSREAKTISKDGKRAQLSASYCTHVNSWLRSFASSFTGTAVCDLTKEHIGIFMAAYKDLSSKNRNDRRAALRMFLAWATRQDFLPANHRLFEADAMQRETLDEADTDFFRPAEFADMLASADADLRPVIAIAGLAGLRGEEIMRLSWADVWRASGHIEVSASKSKTRQRRLVEICPSLAAWLEPYRAQKEGLVFPNGVHVFQRAYVKLRASANVPDRRNGLRHAFCTYHFALHANENLTAQQAGNSPAMIHAHYRALATKAEAESWFAIAPAPAAANVVPISAALA